MGIQGPQLASSTFMLKLSVVAAVVLTLPGCVATDDTSAAESPIVEGSPEAQGILALLRDQATTVALLDVDVALDRRAATNLIAHREGADGVPGTADDDAFDSIQEVDAIAYVGATALERLQAYAEAHGFVPSGGDLLGVFDNVAFTIDEANATLALANSATLAELDISAALDRRAATNIIAARPLGTMQALANVAYVGQSAMLALREYPKTLVPNGLKKVGQECTAHSECETGLCSGMQTPWLAPMGFCMPQDTAGTFETSSSIGIPDNGSSSLIAVLPVRDLATVPLDVVIDLEIDHPRKQDLVVVLYQPGGAEAVLWNHEANPPTHIVTPNGLEGDNMVNGDWQLEITDTVTGQQGRLNHWKMWITSNWD